MTALSQDALREYVRGAVQILRRSIEWYDGGETVFYRVMAVELRLLLCDTTRRHDEIIDLALLPRFAADLRLPVLTNAGEWDAGGQPLEIGPWLDQTVSAAGGRQISLRQLIREVCEQDGGAHVDWRRHTDLAANTGQARWIRTIAGLLVEELDKRL